MPRLVGTVIRELELDAEVRLAEKLDHFLEQVATLSADAHQVALDGSLNSDLAVLDGPDDIFALLDSKSGLNGDFLPDGGASSRLDWIVDEVPERDLSLHELLLQHVNNSLELEIIGAGDDDLLVLLVELNFRLRVFQIEASDDFLGRLLNCVQHFRHVHDRDHVETIIRHAG